MTQTCTQKRYRQYHQDSAAPRFRDLPPRFKRQKSSSSKVETELDNQENKEHFKEESQPVSNCTFASEFQASSVMKQPMSQVFNKTTPLQDPSLSVNTKLYSNPPFQVVDQYGRGYLCYQECGTPPISPYGIVNHRLAEPATCGQRLASPYSDNIRVNSRPTSSESMSPCLEMAKVASQGVKGEKIRDSSNQGHQMTINQVDQSRAKSNYQAPDYSDPDLRTMEMLRELERVADQKEKEDQEREQKEREESGDLKEANDRKIYVSHHLRMLMCAVDRYTADVDDVPDLGTNSQKKGTWQGKAATKQSFDLNTMPKKLHGQNDKDTSKSTSHNGRPNLNWIQANNPYNPAINYQSQHWSNGQQHPGLPYGPKMGHHIPPTPMPTPLGVLPNPMLPVTPPLMHHVLTPPPSRTSSPHLSPSQHKSAPVTPQTSFNPKQHTLPSQLVAKTLEFGNENVGKHQGALYNMVGSIVPQDFACSNQAGWDIWSGPSIFDIHSTNNFQKERKPLYNR